MAEAIALALAERKFKVWFDRSRLQAAGTFHAEIERAVQKCDLAIFLISPESIKSNYVQTELKYTKNRFEHPACRVLSVMVAPTLIADVPAYLKSVGLLVTNGDMVAETAGQAQRLARPIRSNWVKSTMFKLAAVVIIAVIVSVKGREIIFPPNPPVSRMHKIISALDSEQIGDRKCLGVQPNDNPDRVQLLNCNGDSQHVYLNWNINNDRILLDNKCLTVASNKNFIADIKKEIYQVQITECDGGDNQRWLIDDKRIYWHDKSGNESSYYCLDVFQDKNKSDEYFPSIIQIFKCQDDYPPNQEWTQVQFEDS